MEYKIKELNVSDIKPDKNQPRKTFDDEQLQHLAESILSNGLLNPIEVDEDNIITDGERRWKSHKIAGIKKITVRVVKNQDKTEKLRRQLIFTLQDEEIPTEEKFLAIGELWKSEKSRDSAITVKELGTQLGLDSRRVSDALTFCKITEKQPESKNLPPSLVIQTSTLPEKERKEIIEEFKNKNLNKQEKAIDELIKVKKKEVSDKKIIAELEATNKKLAEAKKTEIKVSTTKEVLMDIRDGIFKTHDELNNLMGRIRRIRKTKLYLYNARDKETFLKVLIGASERARKWADELDDLRENLEMEIVKE